MRKKHKANANIMSGQGGEDMREDSMGQGQTL